MTTTIKKMQWSEFSQLYCERQMQDRDALKAILQAQARQYHPDGWMLLECQQLDSSRCGALTILPYGPSNTYQKPPNHPISPRGLASDMSIVIGTLELSAIN